VSPAPRVGSLAQWAAGLGLVALAWGVIAVTPGDDFADQPFVTQARIDEPAEGRNLRITVLDARRADHVSDERGWSADGTWVLVSFEAEALSSEKDSTLSRALLRIGDRAYTVSDRPSVGADARTHLAVGVPKLLTAAFEILDEDADAQATLELGFAKYDARLDSEIRLALDLAELDVDDTAEIPDGRWAE